MCELWSKATPDGREPDYGDGVTTIYRHRSLDGFLIRTHRTVRTSPAGWVYGVYDSDGSEQYTYGYAGSQREALRMATHYTLCRKVA